MKSFVLTILYSEVLQQHDPLFQEAVMVQWLGFGSLRRQSFLIWWWCAIHPASSLRNGTKNTGGPLCVCTPHMQSKDPPLSLWVSI